MKINLTVDEYREHASSYDGVCLACGTWTVGDVEPDAEGLPCDNCGANRVMGTEQALLEDVLLVEEEDQGEAMLAMVMG